MICKKCHNKIEGKSIRFWCRNCYSLLLRRGEIKKVNGLDNNTECKICGISKKEIQFTRGWCVKCYQKHLRLGEIEGKLVEYERRFILDDCDIEIGESDRKEAKLLLTKWKWNFISPTDYFRISSVWTSIFGHVYIIVRKLNSLKTSKQIELMIRDLGEVIKK